MGTTVLSKEQKPSRPARSGKHWIFVLSYDLKATANLWAELRQAAGKDYTVIEYDGNQQSNQLGDVKNSDVLYLFGHGEPHTETGKEYSLQAGGKWKTPKEVAYLLFKKGLNPSHREIKLFSCNSVQNETAQKLQLYLRLLGLYYDDAQPYPSVVVYGYEGTVAALGKDVAVSAIGWDALKLLAKPSVEKHRTSLYHKSLNKVTTFDGQEYRAKHQRIQYGDFE
jgi:hypothetical protein